MKKRLPVGLLVEGNSTHSTVLRLSQVSEELGPVKSAGLSLASRVSNYLRAGYAVENYEDLQAARLVLLHIPDSAVARIVGELCGSDLAFRDLSFVLSESWLTVEALRPLRERGASVATLVAVSSIGRDWFMVEGQVPAVRQIRRLIELSNGKALELRAGTKELYFAAELLITVLPIPLLTAARDALRTCGITGNHLYSVVDVMAQKMLRDVGKGSRASWTDPLSRFPPEIAAAYFESLRRNNPQLAALVDHQLGSAFQQADTQTESAE